MNLRKTKSNFLNLKFFLKSTRPSLPLKKGLSKTHQSSLTLKGGSTSHLGLLPSGEKRKPLLLVALNRFAIWMADHQRSTPAAELRFFCAGMNPPCGRAAYGNAGTRIDAWCWLLATCWDCCWWERRDQCWMRWWKYFLFDFGQDWLWRGSHQGYGGNLVTTIGI